MVLSANLSSKNNYKALHYLPKVLYIQYIYHNHINNHNEPRFTHLTGDFMCVLY